MNSLYVASHESLSWGHTIKFLRILKSLNTPWIPMSLCDAVGTAYTPFHFVEVRHFMMIAYTFLILLFQPVPQIVARVRGL